MFALPLFLVRSCYRPPFSRHTLLTIECWQLVINTGTTVVTFLMVFLIQNTQNRDTAAIQLKLDELIRSTKGAHNALLDLEELDDKLLEGFRNRYEGLARDARARLARGLSDTDAPDA